MNQFIEFFLEGLPSWDEVVWVGPGAFLFSWAQLWLSAEMRTWGDWRAGHSRKLFHTQVFITAAVLSAFFGLSVLCIYGVAVSVWVGVSLLDVRGLGRALIREEDAPWGRMYVILPYMATLIGGVCNHTWMASGAVTGMLVVGICDAIAEPIGLRWGKQQLKLGWVPWLKDATRTLEGSCSVFISSFLIFLLINPIGMGWGILLLALIGAIGVVLTEALSPHGADNLTLQIFGAFWGMVILSNQAMV